MLSLRDRVDRFLLAAILLGALAIGVVAPNADNWENGALFAPVIATGVLAIGTVIVLHRRNHEAFSPLGLICLFYFATYSLGAAYWGLLEDNPIRHAYDLDGMIVAAWLGFIGLCALILGYASNLFGFVRDLLPALPRTPTRGLVPTLVAIEVIGWAARVQQILWNRYFYNEADAVATGGGSWIVSSLAILPLVAMGAVGATYYMARARGERAPTAQHAFYALLAIEVAYNAPRGSRAAFLTIIMLVVILRYYALRKRPSLAATVALVGVGVFVLFPLLYTLRNSGPRGVAYSDQLRTSAQLSLDSFLHQSPAEAVDSGLTATFERFSGSTAAAAIVSCRCEPPRDPGETLAWTVTSLPPRALVPSKPNPGAFGQEFGNAYGFTSLNDQRTSVAQTHVGELYMNYGLPAIAIGMLLIGAFYRLLGDYFSARQTDPLVLAIYAATAWALVNSQEAIIASSVPGQAKLLAVLSLVVFGLVWVRRVPS